MAFFEILLDVVFPNDIVEKNTIILRELFSTKVLDITFFSPECEIILAGGLKQSRARSSHIMNISKLAEVLSVNLVDKGVLLTVEARKPENTVSLIKLLTLFLDLVEVMEWQKAPLSSNDSLQLLPSLDDLQNNKIRILKEISEATATRIFTQIKLPDVGDDFFVSVLFGFMFASLDETQLEPRGHTAVALTELLTVVANKLRASEKEALMQETSLAQKWQRLLALERNKYDLLRNVLLPALRESLSFYVNRKRDNYLTKRKGRLFSLYQLAQHSQPMPGLNSHIFVDLLCGCSSFYAIFNIQENVINNFLRAILKKKYNAVFLDVYYQAHSNDWPKDKLQLFIADNNEFAVCDAHRSPDAYSKLRAFVQAVEEDRKIFKPILPQDERNKICKSILPQDERNMSALLYLACTRGYVDLVNFTIKQGADVNYKHVDSTTPLIQAAINGNVVIANILINHQADINYHDSRYRTALNMAVDSGAVGLVNMLLENKAETSYQDLTIPTPLLMAALKNRLEVAQRLLECGADVNAVSVLVTAKNLHVTPLWMAIRLGHLDMVKLLLQYKVKVCGPDRDRAQEIGYVEIAKTLEEYMAGEYQHNNSFPQFDYEKKIGEESSLRTAVGTSAHENSSKKSTSKFFKNVELQEGSNKPNISFISRKGLSIGPKILMEALHLEDGSAVVGEAIDDGGCFFDSFAQAINKLGFCQKNSGEAYSEKSLRKLCWEYYQKNKQQVDDWNQGDAVGGRFFYDMVQYTKPELDRDFNEQSPVWGRYAIEGKMLCAQLDIPLIHVIEVNQDPDDSKKIIATCFVITATDEPKKLCAIEYDNSVPTLVVSQQDLHFVPILPPRMSSSTDVSSASIQSVSYPRVGFK